MDMHWPQGAGTSISEYSIEGMMMTMIQCGVRWWRESRWGRHMSIREWRFNEMDVSVLGKGTNIW